MGVNQRFLIEVPFHNCYHFTIMSNMTDIFSSGMYEQALTKILMATSTGRTTWALTGSLGMALQGVPTAVHDIDIQTTAQGAYALERYLTAWMESPVSFRKSETIRSHFGKGKIAGVVFEIMGDVRVLLPDRQWRKRVDLHRHRRWVAWQGWQVPVLSIQYEIQAYQDMGRLEKAAMLKEWSLNHPWQYPLSTNSES